MILVGVESDDIVFTVDASITGVADTSRFQGQSTDVTNTIRPVAATDTGYTIGIGGIAIKTRGAVGQNIKAFIAFTRARGSTRAMVITCSD
jgi:hypothetical protein